MNHQSSESTCWCHTTAVNSTHFYYGNYLQGIYNVINATEEQINALKMFFFLLCNNVKLTSSPWSASTHGRNNGSHDYTSCVFMHNRNSSSYSCSCSIWDTQKKSSLWLSIWIHSDSELKLLLTKSVSIDTVLAAAPLWSRVTCLMCKQSEDCCHLDPDIKIFAFTLFHHTTSSWWKEFSLFSPPPAPSSERTPSPNSQRYLINHGAQTHRWIMSWVSRHWFITVKHTIY